MGQEEILLFLYNKRAGKDDAFFSVCDITQGVKQKKDCRAIRRQLNKLFLKGFIQLEPPKKKGRRKIITWRKAYRLRANKLKILDKIFISSRYIENNSLNPAKEHNNIL